MLYRLLADLVFSIHFLFILLIIFGGLAGFIRRWALFVHLPLFVWGVLILFVGLRCPLTPLEQWLLTRAADAEAYSGGFIDYYIVSWIYPEGLTRTHQVLLGIALLVFNFMVYYFVVCNYRESSENSQSN